MLCRLCDLTSSLFEIPQPAFLATPLHSSSALARQNLNTSILLDTKSGTCRLNALQCTKAREVTVNTPTYLTSCSRRLPALLSVLHAYRTLHMTHDGVVRPNLILLYHPSGIQLPSLPHSMLDTLLTLHFLSTFFCTCV